MYMTATRNLALSHHSERRRKSSKLSRTGLDIDAIHRSETNTRFFEDVSNHCVGFLFNDMIMICSTHFSTPQTPRTGLRETASKKKRIQETDALLGKKSMRYKSHISLEFDPDSPLIWIRNIISDHDFSHMFQLVTKDVIYTFKMKSEDIKTRWMNAIQSTIESFKKKNGQDVFIENGRKSFQQIVSRGYLDIPEAWIFPSILRIQSLARTYLACLKTQRIKKKSRKNPKTKLDSVIQKVSQLDNILLQNQSFVESYPKKQASAVTILQNYEEDVNENYIEDQQEDSEEEETPLSTNVTTSISTISQPTRRSTITPRGTPSTPVVLNSSSPREFENRDNNQDKKVQHSTNSVAIEPQQQQQVETKTNHLESHSQKPVEMTADNVSAIPSSNNPSNLLNSEMYAKEIVYEDEFGKEYVVRIGDEIIYEDDFGNQVSEIVTLEKFLEMLENAKQEELMKASTSMQHQVAEKQQVSIRLLLKTLNHHRQ
ncbi:hypothetical protein C9374_007772 [Naegleria lovaniensis]|uniref:PH domain-containing protein n=1 Tax=Naegleria lovaniensis TaxID=51637 RepID=A0AA88GGS7_NAELO|nr:uncharacterized protein C9374_007772 [Naegleria lovaniensis]KAG2379134.1 hypothetical protein C9374_007772 [Naegleria lovaniensis]